jgi:hypothetical protein
VIVGVKETKTVGVGERVGMADDGVGVEQMPGVCSVIVTCFVHVVCVSLQVREMSYVPGVL